MNSTVDMEHGEATLVTERLTLTPLTPADADGMAVVYADPAMYEFTGGAPPTVEQLRERYARLAVGWNHDGSTRWSNWIVRLSGNPEPIGAIQASIAADWTSAAVAWEIGVAAQGHGYAQEAARAVVDWLVSRGTATIEASIHPRHHASGRVGAACGLVPTAERDDGEVVWRRAL